MKLSKLITALHEIQNKLPDLDHDPDVAVFSSHDFGDDVLDWAITHVHTGWNRGTEYDTVALEIDFDQRAAPGPDGTVAVSSQFVADALNEYAAAFGTGIKYVEETATGEVLKAVAALNPEQLSTLLNRVNK